MRTAVTLRKFVFSFQWKQFPFFNCLTIIREGDRKRNKFSSDLEEELMKYKAPEFKGFFPPLSHGVTWEVELL